MCTAYFYNFLTIKEFPSLVFLIFSYFYVFVLLSVADLTKVQKKQVSL